MQNTFENLVSQMNNSVALSQSFLLQYQDYFEQGKYTMLMHLHEQLAALDGLKHIHGVSVYYRDWGYVVSSEPGMAGLDYYMDSLFLKSLDAMGFRFHKTLVRRKPLRNGEYVPVLTIIRSIPVYYATEFPEAWVIIDIDLASLNQIMEEIFETKDNFFAIISEGEMPFVSIGSESLQGIIEKGIISLPQASPSSLVRRVEYPGHLVLYAPSRSGEWNFIYIEPDSVIVKDWFGGFFAGAVGITAIVLVLSVAGSLFFSRRIFNPIKNHF